MKRTANVVISRVTSLPSTTLRPQCLLKRDALHRATAAFFSRTVHSAQLRPTPLRLLGEKAQPAFLDETELVVVVEALGTLSLAFNTTGFTGWATR